MPVRIPAPATHRKLAAAAAGEKLDLGAQRMAPGPIVELIQPGTEQKDQVAKEIACEQEGGPGLRAIELVIAIPQHDRPHLPHQQPGEQRAWQQDGEEVHQANEEFLRLETHAASPLLFYHY